MSSLSAGEQDLCPVAAGQAEVLPVRHEESRGDQLAERMELPGILSLFLSLSIAFYLFIYLYISLCLLSDKLCSIMSPESLFFSYFFQILSLLVYLVI